jgi:hypothetical protein
MKAMTRKNSRHEPLKESHVISLEQTAERMMVENQKLKSHVGLLEIINKFNRTSKNYIAVMANLINEQIKKQPSADGGIINQWKNTKVALLAAEYGTGETDDGEAADSFAVHTVRHELEARGKSIEDAGDTLEVAALVVSRLIEYKKAYLRWHRLFLKKECPEVDHPDSEMRDAAFAGFLLRNGELDHPAATKWLNRITQEEKSIRNVPHLWSKSDKSKAENLARCLRRAQSGQQKAKWKHPALDAWLLLIWPLVEAENWNYTVVHYLADKKFPDFYGKPMNGAAQMGDHCKKTLGLKIKNPKGGRPKNNQFDLCNPSPLHSFAIQIGDSFPDFSSFPKSGSKS